MHGTKTASDSMLDSPMLQLVFADPNDGHIATDPTITMPKIDS